MKNVGQLQTIQQIVQHCRRGDLNSLKRALDFGFNVNTIDPVSTDSPLMIACRCGHAEIVRLCLTYGAKNDPHPDFGQTALHAAVSEGQYYCAAVLLEVAAQSDAASIISNLSDSNGQTPLHVAATVGDCNMIELLLSCDARISCVDVHGQTSLHLCGGSGNESCLAMLLDHSGDELIENVDINGNTVLHHASYNGHINCVRLLLETAANVMVSNHKGQTPYNLAHLRGHKDIVKLLTEYGEHHHQVMTHNSSNPIATPMKSNQSQPPLSISTPGYNHAPPQEVFSTPQQGSFLPRPPHTLASPSATSPRFNPSTTVQQQLAPPPPLHSDIMTMTPDTNGYLTARNSEERSVRPVAGGLQRQLSNNSIRLDVGVEGIPVYTKQKIIQNVKTYDSVTNNTIQQNNFMPPAPLGGNGNNQQQGISSGLVHIEFEDPTPEKHSSPYDEAGGRVLASPPSTPSVQKNLNLQYNSPSPPYKKNGSHLSPTSPQYGEDYEYAAATADEESYADPLEVFTAHDILWNSYNTEDGHVYYLDMNNGHSQWEDPRVHGLIYMDEYATGEEQHTHFPPKSPSPKAMEKIRNFGSLDERDDKHSVVKKIDWDEAIAKNNNSSKSINTASVDEEKNVGKIKDNATFLKFQSKAEEVQLSMKFSMKDELARDSKTAEELFSSAAPKTVLPVAVEQDEVKCQGYLDKYKAGKSLLELRELMESNRESQAFILHVFAAADEISTSSNSINVAVDAEVGPETVQSRASTVAEPVSVVAVTLESVAADPQLSKYIRMSKMGVPVQSILAKMKLDDVEMSQRNKVMMALGGELEVEPGSVISASTSTKSANFQALHWNTLPAERLKNSIWSFNEGATAGESSLVADNEIQELEKLFSSSTRQTKEVCKVVDKQVIPLKILERKRAQNIAIGLVAFKVFGSHLDILKAICSLNTMDNKLSVDHLDNFRNLLPTDAEMKRIQDIRGSKHPAELFIQTALLFYPELPRRLTSFAICLQFSQSCQQSIQALKLVINCCNQVLSSSRLAKLLKKMLAIGNVMNQGTNRGQAAGFTLDSLLKMVNTKGVDNKTSLLDYVVKSLYDKGEQNILAVVDDLNLIDKTTKMSDTEIMKEIDVIQKNFKFLNDELHRNQATLSSGNVLTSPTAKLIVNDFDVALQQYLHSFSSSVEEVSKWSTVMRRKVTEIIEYFGEDKDKCDTLKIFNVLQDFRTALLFSKESIEWKIKRANGSEV